jgi:hypothetical protein
VLAQLAGKLPFARGVVGAEVQAAHSICRKSSKDILVVVARWRKIIVTGIQQKCRLHSKGRTMSGL